MGLHRAVTSSKDTIVDFALLMSVTVTLIMAYLIIANADKFAVAVQAAGSVYSNAVKTLQGR